MRLGDESDFPKKFFSPCVVVVVVGCPKWEKWPAKNGIGLPVQTHFRSAVRSTGNMHIAKDLSCFKNFLLMLTPLSLSRL